MTWIILQPKVPRSHLLVPVGELQSQESCDGHQERGATQCHQALVPLVVLPWAENRHGMSWL